MLNHGFSSFNYYYRYGVSSSSLYLYCLLFTFWPCYFQDPSHFVIKTKLLFCGKIKLFDRDINLMRLLFEVLKILILKLGKSFLVNSISISKNGLLIRNMLVPLFLVYQEKLKMHSQRQVFALFPFYVSYYGIFLPCQFLLLYFQALFWINELLEREEIKYKVED